MPGVFSGELYIGFRYSRNEKYRFPRVGEDGSNKYGEILSGVCELDESNSMEINIEFPEAPKETIHLGFFNSIEDASENLLLNSTSYLHHLDRELKFTKKARLKISVQNGAYIQASIILEGKKSQHDKELNIGDFNLDKLSVSSGKKFIGIDFGNSNSYAVESLVEEDLSRGFNYPRFTYTPAVKARLVTLEEKFSSPRLKGILRKEYLQEYAHKQVMLAVYHSNKIENDSLSFGETKAILEKAAVDIMSKDEIEVRNLASTYEWMISTFDQLIERPTQYIRELNRRILSGLEDTNGNYRTTMVSISGSNFVPARPFEISVMMEMLETDIKAGIDTRSFLEFACSIHTKFVHIHPFIDGNGRTARLILDALLMNAGCPPVVVKSDEKIRYIDSLSASNSGDISDFLWLYIDSLGQKIRSIEDEFNSLNSVVLLEKNKSVYEDLDSQEDPLGYVINRISAGKLERRIEHFSFFYSECEMFYSCFEKMKNTKSEVLSSDCDITFTVKRRGQLSESTCREIMISRDEREYWFFSVDIQHRGNPIVELVFSFQLDLGSACGISLILGKINENFIELTSEPIRLRKLTFNTDSGKLVAMDFQGGIQMFDYSRIANVLLAEIIHFYAPEC
jgi:fido (protein-threonine AMPylation protein)